MILIISKCAICDSVRRSPIYKLPHHAYINFVSHNSRCRSIICISFFFSGIVYQLDLSLVFCVDVYDMSLFA